MHTIVNVCTCTSDQVLQIANTCGPGLLSSSVPLPPSPIASTLALAAALTQRKGTDRSPCNPGQERLCQGSQHCPVWVLQLCMEGQHYHMTTPSVPRLTPHTHTLYRAVGMVTALLVSSIDITPPHPKTSLCGQGLFTTSAKTTQPLPYS